MKIKNFTINVANDDDTIRIKFESLVESEYRPLDPTLDAMRKVLKDIEDDVVCMHGSVVVNSTHPASYSCAKCGKTWKL